MNRRVAAGLARIRSLTKAERIGSKSSIGKVCLDLGDQLVGHDVHQAPVLRCPIVPDPGDLPVLAHEDEGVAGLPVAACHCITS
jgi:hypothetical protein